MVVFWGWMGVKGWERCFYGGIDPPPGPLRGGGDFGVIFWGDLENTFLLFYFVGYFRDYDIYNMCFS